MANAVVEALAIDAVEHLRDLALIVWARQKGVIRTSRMNASEGHSICSPDAPPVITVNADIEHEGKRRFVIAHELGHLELHRNQAQANFCSKMDMEDYRGSGREWEANDFAANLLMPTKLFEPRCDVEEPSLTTVSGLADVFGTSLTAAAIRFVSLCPERCALVASKDGRILWSHRGPEFARWPHRRGTALSKWTYAYDVFQPGKPSPPDRPADVRADAWLLDDAVSGEDDIYEHTRALGGCGMALSLLWLRPDSRL